MWLVVSSCLLSFVVRCLLFAVCLRCGWLFVVFVGLLFVVCFFVVADSVLFVACSLCVVRCLLFAVCAFVLVHGACCLLFVGT